MTAEAPKDYLLPNWQQCQRVHDWKNHVTEEIIGIWETFNEAQKAAIARMADQLANDEDWN